MKPKSKPLVELVIERDPDGGTYVQVFADGIEVNTEEYVIDAGAGYEWDDWKEVRDNNLAAASSPAVRAALENAYKRPAGWQYIDGKPDDEDWL